MQDSKAPAPVYLVVDARATRKIPSNLIPVANYAARHRRANSPKMFVLTSNMLIKSMGDFIAQIFPADFATLIFLESEDELIAELQS